MAARSLQILFLGSGTSTGVPMIGCKCATCRSSDPRDSRTRSSVLFRWHDGAALRQVLVDTSTDLRFQALREGLNRIDAVLYTHSHADHVHGLDELRSFNFIQKTDIPCYGSVETLEKIRSRFDYIFVPGGYEGGGLPKLTLHAVEDNFELFGMKIEVLPVRHGPTRVFGYRVGPIAYITDCNEMPEETLRKVRGARLFVVGATQRKSHPTHFNLDQAIEAIGKTGAQKGYITHMNHDLKHNEVSAELPPGVALAHDGLLLEEGL